MFLMYFIAFETAPKILICKSIRNVSQIYFEIFTWDMYVFQDIVQRVFD